MAKKLQFVLSYDKTYPTFDVLGTQFAIARSKAHENLHKLSPILYDTLVHLELLPYRELATPACTGLAPVFIRVLLGCSVDSTEDGQQRVELGLGQACQSFHLTLVSDA